MLLSFFYIYSSQQPSATRSSLFLSPGRLAETRGSVVRVDYGCLLGPINRSVGRWTHCTLKITSTVSQITFTLTPVNPVNPVDVNIDVAVVGVGVAEDPASCKLSSRGSGLLQMIIQMIRPLSNDHPEDLAT